MASTDKLIRIILKLEDQMSGELDKASSKLGAIGDKMTSVGKGLTAGLTVPIVGLGTAMFKTFSDFEDVMAEIQARTQATTDEMEIMQDAAIKFGRETVFSATEASQAMLELTASGSSAADAVSMLPHVLNLAAAGNVELAQSADAVTDIMKMYGTSMDEVADVTNSLAEAAGSSSATVGDLIQGFNNVGPVASQFGLSVSETSAALAVFAESGIKGAEAGTQLRSMLLNMTRDTDGVKGAWLELGTSMYDASGNMRDIDDIFDDINEAMEGMSSEDQIRIARELGGSYGIMGFNALRAADGIDAMQEQMWSSASAADVADARMNTLSGRFASLMGSLETLAIVMGDLGDGPLKTFIEWLTGVVNKVTEWAQANPKLAQTVMLVVGALALLGPILIIVGSLVNAVATLMPLFTVLGGVIGALSLPVIALGVAIAALMGLIVKWNTSGATETWSNNFKMAGNIIQQSVQKTGNALQNGAKTWGANFNQMGSIFDKLKVKFTQFAVEVLPKLIMAFKQIMPAIKELGVQIMQGLITGIASKAAEFVNSIKNMANQAKNAVKSAFKIQSPSKVMLEMGQQVVAGFNNGVEGSGGIGVNVPSLGSGGLSPAMAGGNVTQNFNIYSSGTTQEQLDHIMKEIGKRVKRQGAKPY